MRTWLWQYDQYAIMVYFACGAHGNLPPTYELEQVQAGS